MRDEELDILINKYIEDDISEDELEILKENDEFVLYKKIIEYSSEFYVSGRSEDELYDDFIKKRTKKKTKVVNLKIRYLIGSIAASIIMILGITQLLGANETFSTNYGEQLSVFLPDSSQVILNAKSKIVFDKNNWKFDRKINLDGEALFKVKKGSQFDVITAEGNIAVLGTQFNVNVNEDFIEITCFEGKVRVTINDTVYILNQGEAIRKIKESVIEKWQVNKGEPSWRKGESNFNNVPLKYVLESIKKNHKVKIIVKNIDQDQRFTGSFSSTNLEVALMVVSESMELDYQISNKDKTITIYKP